MLPYPPIRLRDADPFKIPFAQQQMPQTTPKRPGLLSRVGHGLANAFFPIGPGYRGLLSDEDQNSLQSQGLLQAGMNVLAQSDRSNPLPALGRGMQGVNWPEMLSSHMETAASLNNYQKTQARDSQRQGIIDKFPIPENATPAQMGATLMRMLPEFTRIGDMEMVGKLTELLKSMQLGENGSGTPHAGLRDGHPDQFMLGRNGDVRWLGIPPTERTGQQQMQDQRMFQRENSLRDDYSKKIGPIEDAYRFVDQSLKNVPLARAGDGASQVELLYAFVKAMDPQSVVREGEIGLARQAAGIYDQARGFIRKIEAGQAALIPPGLVDQMANAMNKRLAGYERRWRSWRDLYVQRGKRWGVDAEAFYDVPSAYDKPAGGAAAQGDSATSATDQLRRPR